MDEVNWDEAATLMEREDSGLEVARWMRQELDNQFTRIVLRTGQPGQAPEERVIVDYDINDYKEKTELDRTKLFTTTFAALRAYRDIMKVEDARRVQQNYREGLERVISASTHLFRQRNLKDFASGLLQQVVALLRLEQSEEGGTDADRRLLPGIDRRASGRRVLDRGPSRQDEGLRHAS